MVSAAGVFGRERRARAQSSRPMYITPLPPQQVVMLSTPLCPQPRPRGCPQEAEPQQSAAAARRRAPRRRQAARWRRTRLSSKGAALMPATGSLSSR